MEPIVAGSIRMRWAPGEDLRSVRPTEQKRQPHSRTHTIEQFRPTHQGREGPDVERLKMGGFRSIFCLKKLRVFVPKPIVKHRKLKREALRN